jgi:Na+/citrate or Na+/malate symporter
MQLGPLDYCLWVTSFLLEAYVVVCSIFRKEFLRYIPLNLYMVAVALVTWGQYHLVHIYGLKSQNYFYYYYYSDSLLCILMYLVIIHFYQEVFAEMKVSRYIRGAAALLLAATAFFSYIVVHDNKQHMTTSFVVELEQNINFVVVVLTYLLWGAILKLRETRTRLIQLVLALGVAFSATAGSYALRNLFPEAYMLRWVPPLMGVWLPLAWAYTFTRVPEDARLATERLLARAR